MHPKIITYYDPKPIPIDRFDWDAVYEDDRGETAVGYGATKEEAIQELLDCFPRESDE